MFGELYGSAVETRFGKDIVEVPVWLEGGPEPSTVREGVMRPDRLLTMSSRLSAAYKGVHALLMRQGARDLRSGQSFDQTVFFDEGVDIHHIFPRAWCEAQKLPSSDYHSVVNKTPLTYKTNRIIGGIAPSKYLDKLEKGKTEPNGQIVEPAIDRAILDGHLRSHCIPVAELRADDFHAFIKARQQALLALICQTTGQVPQVEAQPAEEGDELSPAMAQDTGLDLVEPD